MFNSQCSMSNVQYWIRTCFGYAGFYAGALLLDNLLKDFGSVLFALIVTYHANLYLLLIAKVLMVVHLAGYKRICLILNSFVQQKVASTAA